MRLEQAGNERRRERERRGGGMMEEEWVSGRAERERESARGREGGREGEVLAPAMGVPLAGSCEVKSLPWF